jgi:hypothetical protein
MVKIGHIIFVQDPAVHDPPVEVMAASFHDPSVKL